MQWVPIRRKCDVKHRAFVRRSVTIHPMRHRNAARGRRYADHTQYTGRHLALRTSGFGKRRMAQTVSFLSSNFAVLSSNVKKVGMPAPHHAPYVRVLPTPRRYWCFGEGGGASYQREFRVDPNGRGTWMRMVLDMGIISYREIGLTTRRNPCQLQLAPGARACVIGGEAKPP